MESFPLLSSSLFLLLLLTTNGIHSDPITTSICDDGKYKIQDDIGNEKGQCEGSKIIISQYLKPAGVSHCTDHTLEGSVKCMNEAIHYSTTPPSSGDYRQLAPKYGEYSYLPPQRWIHALKYGAIVFLYHPCAPLEQVMELKQIATSCLRKHIITPYPGLSIEKPLALVSYGCVYNMSWVDRESVERWIIGHGLRTAEKIVTQDGQYDYGLINSATIVSTIEDSTLCPDTSAVTIEPPDLATPSNTQTTPSNDQTTPANNSNGDQTTPTNQAPITPPSDESEDHTDLTTPTNCTNGCGNSIHVTVVYYVSHHVFLVTTFLISLVLFMTLFFTWLYCWRKSCLLKKRRGGNNGKYKPVNQFFPCKNNVIGIAIPEMGLPKTLPSEREKLIIESDEDEL